MTEHAVLFGASGALAGIVTRPAGGAPDVAFVFLNAGVVHRVGPNRIYVTAARRLAALGFLAVRFDLSGLGDSAARRDSTPFDQASVLEAREVLSALQRDYGVSRFVLAGLCSGAVVAFWTALADERVAGAVLINPQGFVRSAEWKEHVVTQARARRYWREKLFSAESWRRALTGRSDYGELVRVAARRLASLVRRDPGVSQIARGLSAEFDRLARRGVRLLLACSEGDYGVDYLKAILGGGFDRLDVPWLDTLTLAAGDHSLTLASSQERLFGGVEAWAAPWRVHPAATPAGAAAGAWADAALPPTHASVRS